MRPRDRFHVDRSHVDNWFYTCRGSRLTEASGRADSLWIVCLRSLLRSIDKVTSRHIEAIPIRVRQLMWQRIRAAELDTIAVWCLFAPLFSSKRGMGPVKSGHFTIDSGHGDRRANDLESYTRRLFSPKLLWLVELTIADMEGSATDLSVVAGLTNLKALTIACVSNVDNRTIRAWSRLASGIDQSDAPLCFQRLDTLVLSGLRGVTEDVFMYLSDFPQLTLFSSCGTGIVPPSKREHMDVPRTLFGWQRSVYVETARSPYETTSLGFFSHSPPTGGPVFHLYIHANIIYAASDPNRIHALGRTDAHWYVRDSSWKAEPVPQYGASHPLKSMNDGHKDDKASPARKHRTIKPSQQKRKREAFALSIDG